MKLTRKAFMDRGAGVSARRAMRFRDMVEKKGGSKSAKMFPTVMVLLGGLTLNRLADNLGLTKEDNEVDVTEEMFDRAMADVVAEDAKDEHTSIVTSLETTIFCVEMSEALFGKENDDET